MKKEIIYGILLFIIGGVIGWLCRPNHIQEVVKTQIDSVVVVDTHIIEKPVLVERTVKEYRTVAVHDTTIMKDSIYVVLPIEKKIYQGEDYLAEISGYKAILERIEVYPKTITITTKETQTVTNRNALALGIEANYFGNAYIPIYLEYSHLLHKNVEMFGKVFYDIPTQQMGVGMGLNLQLAW